MELRDLIREVADFPIPGIQFRDITPLLANGPAFEHVIEWLIALYDGVGLDVVIGIESRGFILGGPLANRLGLGFVPIRKPGKLPAAHYTEVYDLEYGSDALQIHRDALQPGQRAVIVDDLLATGGTAAAATRLVQMTGAHLCSIAFLVEVTALRGRSKLEPYQVESLIAY